MLRAVKTLLGPSIAYKPVLAKAFNSSTTAIFISQCIYWSDKTSDEDLSFYKSREEWHYETGLSEKQVEMAAKRAKEKGVLETNYVRNEHKNYFTLKMGALLELVGAYLEAHPERGGGNTQKGDRQPTKGGFDIHKITQKTTHKNTKEAGKPAPSKSTSPTHVLAEEWCSDIGIEVDMLLGKDWKALGSLAKAGIEFDQLQVMSVKAEKGWKGKGKNLAYLNSYRASLLSGTSKTPKKRRYWNMEDLAKEEEALHGKR